MIFHARSIRAALVAGALLGSISPALAEAVLHRGNAGEPQTLDQAHTSINIEEFILKDLYEGLTIYDAAGKIVPGAAESWTVSDDGTVYIFKLRADAKWSDGSPVTSRNRCENELGLRLTRSAMSLTVTGSE